MFIAFIGCDWKASSWVGLNFPSLVVLGSAGCCTWFCGSTENTFLFNLSCWYLYRVVFLVDCSPCHLICRCPIIFFVYFSICLMINSFVSTGRILRKPCLIDFSRPVVVALHNVAWKYCANYGLFVLSIILFNTVFYCCVTRVNFHILVCLVLVAFNICCPFSWTVLSVVDLVWLYIHNHIGPPTILVVLLSFLRFFNLSIFLS